MFSIFSPLRLITILLLLLATARNAHAVDERYAAKPLAGNQLRKDSMSEVKDTTFFTPALKNMQTSSLVRNIVTFRINEFSNLKMPDTFNISIKFKVYYLRKITDTSGVEDSTAEITLTIGYNKNNAYEAKAIYTFKGGYRSTVKITNVTVTKGILSDFENSLLLENEILIAREYSFSCVNNAVDTVSHNDSSLTRGELRVFWSMERAADEYDLEWTYIDNSALGNYKKDNDTSKYDPRKIFSNNATRVSIKPSLYYIPLLYDGNGRVFYRVRAVQVKANGQRIESAWSSDYNLGLGQYMYNGHERPLNWQATTSFAEDGKRKSVVQYFDGSLRNRQTVTKDNTTDSTIIAETFYDYQGRPVIQVLPTPSLNSLIKFTPNFNRSVNSSEYDKELYDAGWSDSCYCTLGAAPMDSSRGAAQYYSAQNPNKNNGFNKYIPDAQKYPFTETRYTADNTGRVSMQSGVGLAFQIGKKDASNNTHETKYFYGSADQEELDALFGTEVGKASHYFKNMVRDANGQYSVSYVDMHGRTVATALAGLPTSRLDTLSSYTTRTITKKLLDSNNNIVKGLSIESSRGLLVTRAGNNRFVYSLLPDSISIKDCNDLNICYDCKYDLEITITDECNNTSFPGGAPVVITRSNVSGYDIACNPNVAMTGVDTSVYLKEGNYLVTKKLTISKLAMDYYRDSVFMVRNACKTLEQFIQEQKDSLRNKILCQPTCEACEQNLASWPAFRANYMLRTGIPDADSAAYRNHALAAYNRAKEECDELCGNNYGLHTDIRRQMLADLTPPFGQYANPSAIDEYSIFRIDFLSRRHRLYSRYSYYDENGNPDFVRLGENAGTYPQYLTVTQFATEFKPSWANSLLPTHPEYCKLQKYESLAASFSWDEKFSKINTFKAAVEGGYLNPFNIGGLPNRILYGQNIFRYESVNRDPLFTDLNTSGAVSNQLKKEMTDSLNRKINISGTDSMTVWSLATITGHCAGTDANCATTFKPLSQAFNLDTACSGELDIAWVAFREMYLQEKREIIEKILSTACPNAPVLDPAKYALNFPTTQQVTAGLASSTVALNDTINNIITTNCESYATQWWEELKPCNFTADDSARVVSRLIKICQEGGDANHPFGSSSVKPSSTYNFRSFEQFLKHYADSVGKPYNATCNVYLISAPASYEQKPVYSIKPLYSKPDSCECNLINNYYLRYQTYGQYDANFAAYILRTTGITIPNSTLDTLRLSCNNQINCNFLKEPIQLPAIFQCGAGEVCIDCTRIGILVNEYQQNFPGANPSRNDEDSAQHVVNILFTNFMNSKLGFSKDISEYLDFMDTCGIGFIDSSLLVSYNAASVTCNQLTKIADEYYYRFMNPANRVVDLDMRTFAGNKTPDPGPKGVFDVNGKLIGRTDTGTVSQIKTSFANIWNGSSTNRQVGTLFYNESIGKFRLYLNPGQAVPCNGIVGMRYYEFNAHVYDTLSNIGTGIGSYIDFGDSSYIKIEQAYQDSKTKVLRYDLRTAYYEYYRAVGSDYIPHSRIRIDHYYPHTANRSTYPVTIYHTDTMGVVYFNDYQPNGAASAYSNLRGYFPQHTLEISFKGTRDSTINRTSQVKNFSEIDDVQLVDIGHNNYPGNPAPLLHNYLGDFSNNHDLRLLRLEPGYDLIPNSQQSGVVDSLAGRLFSQVFPDLPANFSNIRVFLNYGFGKREYDVAAFNFSLPKLKHVEIAFTDLPVGFMDSFYIRVNRVNQVDSGEVLMGYASNSAPPTSASDAAKSSLASRNWRFKDPNTYDRFYPYGPYDVYSNDVIPMVDPFTDFVNAKLGTNYNLAQVKSLFISRCGQFPSFCLPRPLNGPVLCGRNEPVFPPTVVEQHSPCDDSTSFATWKGTLLYENYRDSLLGSFDDKYIAKCLKARYIENFTVTQDISEFHYTLYYYDQAGNLLKTVPPAGVDLSKFGVSNWSDQVKTARANKTVLTPSHTLATNYRYNTLNQVVAQNSPDGGTSEFWYDRLGRLAISRNAKQKADTVTSLYSYTKYDYLGRISEVGQIKNTVLADTIKDATSRNPSLLNTWLTSRDSLRGQITQTVYDLPYGLFIGLGADRLIIKQRNLRNRVSYVLYQDSGHIPAYSAATFYTYDIHGNVDTLLQDYGVSNSYPNLMNKNGDGNRWKKIAYKYDLISGKVNMVLYQPGWGDQWLHRYSYDAENRLTLVETSRDSLIWERDARYEYYRHGPLARMTIGDQLVQGVDYAYTLQGWLKGVNSTGATATHDIGGDGRNSGDVLNRYTARDAYSYSLNYFAGDYAPINTNVNPFPGSSAYLNTAYRPLYNGNISSMVSNIRKMSDPSMVGGPILLYNYKYDQLNRLTAMDTYNGWVEAGNSWTGGSAAQPSFNERIAYDGNGNILKCLRNANTYNNGNVMDSLTYKYYAGTNRLRRVTDRDTTFDALWGSNSWEYNIDLDHQTDTSNYKYDAIGNLISDSKEGITSIRWSVYGKILEINRAASAKNPVTKIVYKYDPQGNRIGKIISRADTSARFHTWYVRDAQGNILSTYTSNGSATDANLQNLVINQTEKYIYGSSRLGVYTWYEPVDGAPYDMQYFNFASSTYKRGWRQYELTNHLGNVLVTVSDKKFGVALPSSSLIDYYEPDVVAAQDYFPFGMLMPRRSFSSASAYKFGFNGKENDNEVKGLGNQQDYGMRIYDGRVGRFLSTDPLFKNFPWYTPYQFAGNRPIVAIDLEGLEPQEHPYQLQPIGKTFTGVTTEGYVYSSYQVNSPTNGQTWVAKIEQIYDLPNGFKGSIDYFLYYNKDAGWQFWQKGDELSIGHRRRVEGANIIGQGTFWIAFGTAAAFAAPVVASTSWELWVGAHSVPEFIPYFAILGGMSSVGLKGAVGTAEPENIKPTVEQLQIPEEVGPPPAKQDRGLSNPYKNMSLSEVEAAMERQVVKGKLIPKPSAPGNRAYQNTKSKYSYNLDPGSVGKKGRKESPHVDVNYPNPKPKNVPPKKKLPTKEQ